MNNFKKIASVLLLILFVSLSIMADNGIWKIHTVFNENRIRVVDTEEMVYCVTENSLNAYNKKKGSFECFSRTNRLSSNFVKNIYYNYVKKYVVVTYTDFNIDILCEDGTTINIPNLKNISSVNDCTINDVTFGEDCFYVASKVGYLVIEDINFTVKKAAFFNSNVQSIAEVGNKLILSDGNKIIYTSLNVDVKKTSQMTNASLGVFGNIYPIDNNHFFLNGSALYLVTIKEDGSFSKVLVSSGKVYDVQPIYNGFMALGGTSSKIITKYYQFDKNGNKTIDITLPEQMKNTLFSSYEEDGSLWRLGANGLFKIKFDKTNNTFTETGNLLVPNCVTAKRIGAMSYNEKNKKIYITSGGPGTESLIQTQGQQAYISSFDGKVWKNEMPYNLKGYSFQDPYKPVFDVNNPDIFYVGTWFQGVLKIKNNEIIAKYDWNNSYLLHALNNWFCQVPCMDFDAYGNLWMLQYTEKCSSKEINILKKESLNKNNDISLYDWIVPEIKTEFQKRLCFIIDKNDNKIIFDGSFDGSIKVIKNDETLTDINTRDFNYFYDQEGKKVTWSLILGMEEDKKGNIWFVGSSGLFSMNPNQAFNENFRITVPKNGNNYILDNVFTTSISIDEYNRKWIGTLDDGIYLLNEDCSKILKHFNSSNSTMPNDRVLCICWNPNTKSVFIGLNGCLLEYKPENESDLSAISMEPNIITPEFNNFAIFSRVPIDATIYIKNNKGKTVKTLQATSSKVFWNCTDENKEFLKTGIYNVSIKLKGIDTEDNLMQFKVIN